VEQQVHNQRQILHARVITASGAFYVGNSAMLTIARLI
jgi:hypothetical protein